MLLAVDIGNTNIVYGLFDHGKIIDSLRVETVRDRNEAQYEISFQPLLSRNKLNYSVINSIIVASVVPQTRDEFEKFTERCFGQKPFDVSNNLLGLGMNVKLDNPKELGADRLVNAIAFYSKYKKAGIIIDFGTATTFDVVDSNGDYLGGMISPGVNLALKALTDAAAKLPEIKIEKPNSAIGHSTKDAMQAGIYYGYLGLIKSSVENIALELRQNGLNEKPMVIATGGLARFFEKSEVIDAIEENLTLNGLLLIYQQIGRS